MNIEPDPNLPPVASKPNTLTLKDHNWVRNELEDVEKTGIIHRFFAHMVHLL